MLYGRHSIHGVSGPMVGLQRILQCQDAGVNQALPGAGIHTGELNMSEENTYFKWPIAPHTAVNTIYSII